MGAFFAGGLCFGGDLMSGVGRFFWTSFANLARRRAASDAVGVGSPPGVVAWLSNATAGVVGVPVGMLESCVCAPVDVVVAFVWQSHVAGNSSPVFVTCALAAPA